MEPYNSKFYKDFQSNESPQAVRLAEYISRHLLPNKFIDFGCSTGIYLLEIKNKIPQIESIGYEFSKDAIENAVCTDIIEFNLTNSIDSEKTENTLGLCLEVLEHIDDKDWKPVLENISKLCDKIIFSAAHTVQNDIGHINCRNKIDWIRRFHSLGWVVCLDSTNSLLDYMRSGYHIGWFTMNAMVLVRAECKTI